jgi:hypothetical protein
MDPDESVAVLRAAEPGNVPLGVHWGTFQLTFERSAIRRAGWRRARARGIDPGRFVATEAGRTFSVPPAASPERGGEVRGPDPVTKRRLEAPRLAVGRDGQQLSARIDLHFRDPVEIGRSRAPGRAGRTGFERQGDEMESAARERGVEGTARRDRLRLAAGRRVNNWCRSDCCRRTAKGSRSRLASGEADGVSRRREKRLEGSEARNQHRDPLAPAELALRLGLAALRTINGIEPDRAIVDEDPAIDLATSTAGCGPRRCAATPLFLSAGRPASRAK